MSLYFVDNDGNRISRDLTKFEQDSLKEHGRILDGLFAHYCNDWDGMTVDETCSEISSCNCLVCVGCPSVYCSPENRLVIEVPEEVKQNARDYYDALDPFSGMSENDRFIAEHGKIGPDCFGGSDY